MSVISFDTASFFLFQIILVAQLTRGGRKSDLVRWKKFIGSLSADYTKTRR